MYSKLGHADNSENLCPSRTRRTNENPIKRQITRKFNLLQPEEKQAQKSRSQGLCIKGLSTLSKRRYFKLKTLKNDKQTKESHLPKVFDGLKNVLSHKQQLEKKKKFNATVSFNRILKQNLKDKDFEKGALIANTFMERRIAKTPRI